MIRDSTRVENVQLSLFDAPAPIILVQPDAISDPEFRCLIDEIGVLRAMNPYADPAYDPMEEWGMLVWGV